MITHDDLTSAHPGASRHAVDLAQHWIDVANVAIDAARVKDPRTLAQARMLFVMHHLEKPALDLKAKHVAARVSRPGRRAANVKATHPWAGTSHGDQLIAAVKF